MAVSYKLKTGNGRPVSLRGPNAHAQVQSHPGPNLRCPHCMHMGTFTTAVSHDLRIQYFQGLPTQNNRVDDATVGVRVCPNPACLGIVMVVTDAAGRIVSLPNEVLDFDPTNIPPPIAASLEEAIKCHAAQCYKAAALMVRRVLEELCEDRGATGNNLKERILALSSIIVIPRDLIQAADHLRLLGNDAAHIEAKTYASIGDAEIRIAIDLTKELLKGAYQYTGLLSRLTALQKSASGDSDQAAPA